MEKESQNEVDEYDSLEACLRTPIAIQIKKGSLGNVDVLDCSVKGLPVKRR